MRAPEMPGLGIDRDAFERYAAIHRALDETNYDDEHEMLAARR